MSKQSKSGEKILAGARNCFALRGYVGATVPELERACGVTRRTLFKHFKNKQRLFIAVLEQEIAMRARYFGQVNAGIEHGVSLQSILEQLFAAQIRWTQGDRAAFRLRLECMRRGELDPTIRPQVEEMEASQLRWRSGLFVRLIALGLLHPDWSAAAANDLMSTMLLGLVAQQSYGFPTATAPSAVAFNLARCLATCLEAPPVAALLSGEAG